MIVGSVKEDGLIDKRISITPDTAKNLNDLGLKKVDAKIMFENGLVRSALKPIKILGDGELKIEIKIVASAFSDSAKKKIEKSGGKVLIQ